MSLADALASTMNADGGWGYTAGSPSRLEPTLWALLALRPDAGVITHRQFFSRVQTAAGWLQEYDGVPANIGFNALAAAVFQLLPGLVPEPQVMNLLAVLGESRGVRAPQVAETPQNNSLQGWSWVEGTFSWIEPTAYALVALKIARRARRPVRGTAERIEEGERLFADRVCAAGGWNFGNAMMMGQALAPYIPTTALALLALRDRPDDPVVERSLAYLEAHWRDEPSVPAVSLAALCLAAFGRPAHALREFLASRAPRAIARRRPHSLALAALALRPDPVPFHG